jgi:hypothetical protein
MPFIPIIHNFFETSIEISKELHELEINSYFNFENSYFAMEIFFIYFEYESSYINSENYYFNQKHWFSIM